MFDNRDLKLDLLALGLLALVVFLTLSLATYHPADPPGSLVWPPSDEVHNACGHSGALASHALLELFGIGAYYLVFSLAVLDYLLLTRRTIDQPWLRSTGWLLSLAGLSTLITLIAPEASPGPVIGPGGYLGAAGRSLLEMNFASAGSYILTLSVLVAGLLLCTDYLLFRYAAQTVEASTKGLAHVGQKLAHRRPETPAKKSDVDEWEAPEPKKGKKGAKAKKIEEEESDEPAEPVGEPAIRIRRKHRAEEEVEEEESPAAEDAEGDVEEPADAEEKPGIRKRVASALRIRKPAAKSEREEVMEELDEAARQDDARDYELPPIDLLLEGETVLLDEHEKEVRQKAKLLEKTFASFGFKVKVVEIETGPVIAQYEVELESGLRLSKITSLSDDLAIALRVPSVRIVAPIPGKNTVGIEIPNTNRQLVRLREVIEEVNGKAKRLKIPIYLGKDVSGKPMVVDLAAMPHLLIAGRTGTGKSVCLNSIIVSMLMTRRPDEVRMLMIDPKMVELSPYKTLPHLMHPVVTDMRKAEAILAWAVDKMEERYALLARAGVRHVTVYNQLGEEELMERLAPEDEEERKNIPRYLPFIVVVADEIADLMMTAGKEVEQHIIRLAQKSRAVGIHLILATQKPTVDVITGLIKSNLPARIAFQVSSRTDSRVVLDEMGADKLLGNGDMLFLLPGTSTLLRGQGTYLSDDEINRVVDFVGTTEPQFVKELVQLKSKDEAEGAAAGGKLIHRDELYEAAVDIIVREGRGSVSLLQRALGIGYGRGARLIDFMAEDGIVGPYNGSQAREVLLTIEQWEAMCGEGKTSGTAVPTAALSPPAAKPAKRSNKIRMEPEEEPLEEEQDEEEDTYEDEEEEEGDSDEYEEDYRAESA